MGSAMAVTIAIILLAIIGSSPAEATCPERAFLGCVLRLRAQRVPFEKSMLAVVFNIGSEARLIRTCKVYSDVMPCFRDKITECGDEKQKRQLAEVGRMLMFLCSPFSMERQKHLIKHHQCIGSILEMPATTGCDTEITPYGDDLAQCRKNCAKKGGTDFVCLMKTWITEQNVCTLSDIAEKCGDEAVDFYTEMQTTVFEAHFPILCEMLDQGSTTTTSTFTTTFPTTTTTTFSTTPVIITATYPVMKHADINRGNVKVTAEQLPWPVIASKPKVRVIDLDPKSIASSYPTAWYNAGDAAISVPNALSKAIANASAGFQQAPIAVNVPKLPVSKSVSIATLIQKYFPFPERLSAFLTQQSADSDTIPLTTVGPDNNNRPIPLTTAGPDNNNNNNQPIAVKESYIAERQSPPGRIIQYSAPEIKPERKVIPLSRTTATRKPTSAAQFYPGTVFPMATVFPMVTLSPASFTRRDSNLMRQGKTTTTTVTTTSSTTKSSNFAKHWRPWYLSGGNGNNHRLIQLPKPNGVLNNRIIDE